MVKIIRVQKNADRYQGRDANGEADVGNLEEGGHVVAQPGIRRVALTNNQQNFQYQHSATNSIQNDSVLQQIVQVERDFMGFDSGEGGSNFNTALLTQGTQGFDHTRSSLLSGQ